MRKPPWVYLLIIFVGLVLSAWVVYQIPPIHNRLSWRIDFGKAYLRGLIDPVDPLPTALPEPEVSIVKLPTNTPARTLTPSVTPTRRVSPTPSPSPTPLLESASLPSPDWEKQDINNCGPASLAMYLRFYGWEGDQTDIADLLKPYREDRNVNVEELDYYVRTRAGWLNVAYRVGGDLALLKQLISAGIPVLIEESFYFDEPFWTNDDLWAAHYLLVTGYDDPTQMFTGQDSFHGPDQQIPYEKLDEYWKAFNRVYFLVYLPHQEDTLQAILGPNWEVDANREHALEVARAETESDPEDAFAWFNLGTNLMYFERYSESTVAYDKSRELGLPQRMLRYQFGPFIAYFHSGKLDDLIALTEYAMEITPNAEEALLWHGWAMYRKGRTADAIDDFIQALEYNPSYLDAQYALDFARTNR